MYSLRTSISLTIITFMPFYLILFVHLFQIEPLEKESMVVKDMYELIDVFQVPTPLEDFAVYQVGRLIKFL